MSGIFTGRGVNVVDKLLSPNVNISQQLHDLATTTTPNIIQKAVVVEVYYDPALITPDIIQRLESTVSNPELARFMPRNAILARIITGGRDKQGDLPMILYPFFPPHMCMPIKPGEHAWVLFETPGEPTKIGYWICRVPEREDVDDVNYTHADRKFASDNEISIADKASGVNTTAPGGFIGFPNGDGSKESLSLKEIDGYEKITSDSIAMRTFTGEPVPRFSKRPGDFAIQGSNNTLIVLGEDRVGPAQDESPRTRAGAIDVVVGRSTRNIPVTETESPRGNAPHVVPNTRGYNETEKSPELVGKSRVITEGDPDFENDLSRVYVAMKTDGDRNFGLDNAFPKLNENRVVDLVDEAPYVVIKTDEVRVIARKSDDATGSIKIIKEGSADADRAVIIMQPDGTIMIDGPKIIVGSGINDQTYIGRDASEPLVLGDTLITLMRQFVDSLVQYTSTAAQSTGNLAAPIPQLISAHGAFQPLAEKFKQDLENALSQVGKVK